MKHRKKRSARYILATKIDDYGVIKFHLIRDVPFKYFYASSQEKINQS
jgi:hypothetical protein